MTTAPPRMSVIVACYNSGGTLARCLESLQRQTRRDFEVLLVDSSSDDSAAAAAARFPGVRLIRLDGRRFPGEARNIGIGKATTDLIAFLDADAVADPDWAQNLFMAHRDPYPLIGGAVCPDRGEDRLSPEDRVVVELEPHFPRGNIVTDDQRLDLEREGEAERALEILPDGQDDGRVGGADRQAVGHVQGEFEAPVRLHQRVGGRRRRTCARRTGG